MIEQADNGQVRTHDEALAVLTYAVPGARVSVYQVQPSETSERTRRYAVTLDRIGHREITRADVYVLPMSAQALAQHARRVADAAAHAAGA